MDYLAKAMSFQNALSIGLVILLGQIGYQFLKARAEEHLEESLEQAGCGGCDHHQHQSSTPSQKPPSRPNVSVKDPQPSVLSNMSSQASQQQQAPTLRRDLHQSMPNQESRSNNQLGSKIGLSAVSEPQDDWNWTNKGGHEKDE
ncbi:hypothetical protein FGO68_gene14109 [Halteria grandinella]|uniref:Uncharacterized protein n=1 Tax=Halteria grandinella TaxID=5974 RepID=A0A8J8T2C3_HALGN|nr:hypothetical protein FGO68_gene14109 [Halteria grandinella]